MSSKKVKDVIVISAILVAMAAVLVLNVLHVRRSSEANDEARDYLVGVSEQEAAETGHITEERETVGQVLSGPVERFSEEYTVEIVDRDYQVYKSLELSDEAASMIDDESLIRAMDYMADDGFAGYVYVESLKPDDSEGGLNASELICSYTGDAEYYFVFANSEHVYEVIVEGDEILVDEFLEW